MYRGQTILVGNSIKWWNEGYQWNKTPQTMSNVSTALNQLNDSNLTYYWLAIKYNS